MCGASSAETQLQDAQIAMYGEMSSQYATEFGENQALLSSLTSAFEPILKAGPNQQGFSPEELQSLESQSTTGVGQNYANAKAAVATEQGAEGGGNTFVPAGAKNEEQAQLATSAAQLSSGEQLGIEQADYQQGLQNFETASGVLAGVAGQDNPAAFANAVTGAGSAASTTANEVTQANNSWQQLVSGAIGAAGSAAGGL